MKQAYASGLSGIERAIYNAVLEGGRVTMAGIARKANINRTTLYPYLAELLRRDYLKQTVSGKRTYYTAANPRNILNQLKKELGSFEEQLPHLLDIYSRAKKQPLVQVHEGREAIFKAFKEAYEEAFYVKTFIEFEKFKSVFSMQKEGAELFRILHRRKFKFQALASNSQASREFLKTYGDDGIEGRLMPTGITYPSEFFIYNQRVLIVSYERSFAVVIESEDITNFLKTIFDFCWGMSREV